MIVSVEGQEKTAKSTFAYTAPLPIVGLSFDMSHDRALHGTKHGELFGSNSIEYIQRDRDPKAPLPDGKGADITVYICPAPMQLDPRKVEGYMDLWGCVLPRVQREIMAPGTLVIDTMTLLTKHRQDAHLEHTGQQSLLEIQYGVPNGSIRDIYTWAKSYDKDLVAVHHLRDEYKDVLVGGKKESMATGGLETHGIKQTRQLVDVVVRNEQERKDGHMIKGTILTCGLAISIEGFPIYDPSWNKLVDMIEGAGWSGQKIRRRINAD